MKNRNLDSLLAPTKSIAPTLAATGRNPKILTLDVETSPNTSYTWGLFNQNISLSQLIESSRMLSFSAKWYGASKAVFYSEHHNGREAMVRAAWDLLNEADILVTYNGISFDVRVLQKEFILAGLTPPSPFKNVDLYRTIKSQFRFPSNKLDYVSKEFGIGQKVKHEGQELWNLVLRDDKKAWARMRKYNIQDVLLTESLFDFLGPWIKNMPHVGLWTGTRCCFRCGSQELTESGFGYTANTVYARLQCDSCGAWNRLTTSKGASETKPLR